MANENDTFVRGMGDGGMQWTAPMQWIDSTGTVVFSIDSAGAAVSASSVTGNSVVDASGAVTFASSLAVTGNLATSANVALSLETGLTAHAGGTQAASLALTAAKSVHNVATVGTAADSVILPAATGSGKIHFIKNSAAANSLQLFAALTETIDGVASATGVAIAAGKSRLVIDVAAGAWVSLYGA